MILENFIENNRSIEEDNDKTELITVSLLKEMGRLRTQILAKFSSFRKVQ